MPDTEQLLAAVGRGDVIARGQLLDRHRPRLKRMVAVRFDRRLAARVDPSDVVQEALVEADRRLDDYLRDRPLPFYPWLRRLGLDRLVDARRRHRGRPAGRSRGRSRPGLPDESVLELAERCSARGTDRGRPAAAGGTRSRSGRPWTGWPTPTARCWSCATWSSCRTAETAAVLGVSEGASGCGAAGPASGCAALLSRRQVGRDTTMTRQFDSRAGPPTAGRS